MLIEQTLAGIRLPWRLPGSFRFFHSFAAKRGSGQLFASTVRVGHNHKHDIVNQVMRLIRNLDWTCIAIPWSMESAASPIQSLARQLHGCDSSSRIDLLRYLDRELRGIGPAIVTALLSSQDEAEALTGSLYQLHSDLDKFRSPDDEPLSLGIVCFCPDHDDHLLDATRGLPVVSPDPILSGPRESAWSAYLHHRIAWEAAGDIDRAIALDSMVAGNGTGDDAAFEAVLNCHAGEILAELGLRPTDCLDAVIRWLRGQDALIAGGQREILTWRPQGTTRYLKPYIARAILTDPSVAVPPDLRDSTRFATVCQPLVGCLFSCTLEIEYRQRAKFSGGVIPTLAGGLFEEEARGHHWRFLNCPDHIDRLLYPSTSGLCPLDPNDWVAFLSYGQVVPGSEDKRTVWLRNALAHGHPASWYGVELLRSCIDDFRLME